MLFLINTTFIIALVIPKYSFIFEIVKILVNSSFRSGCACSLWAFAFISVSAITSLKFLSNEASPPASIFDLVSTTFCITSSLLISLGIIASTFSLWAFKTSAEPGALLMNPPLYPRSFWSSCINSPCRVIFSTISTLFEAAFLVFKSPFRIYTLATTKKTKPKKDIKDILNFILNLFIP